MIEKSELEGILKGTSSLQGCVISVGLSKGKVTLTGKVHSPEQKKEAEQMAWQAWGVWAVGNELVIEQG
jgi:osmotically-inducible protein OsmY